MLDIDFLRDPKKLQHLVHLYQDGCFRPDVASHMRRLSQERGWLWQDFDPRSPSVAGGGALYDAVVISVDLDDLLASPAPEANLSVIAGSIASNPGTHFYLHGRGGNRLFCDAWDAILNAATVLHEPDLSTSTLNRLLAYVGPRLLFPIDRVVNRPTFEQSVRHWVAHSELTLPEFLQILDVIAVTCVDAASGTFDPIAFAKETASKTEDSNVAWVDSLGRFLRSLMTRDRVALLGTLDRALTVLEQTPHDVMGAMYRATFDLGKANLTLNPGEGVIPEGWAQARWDVSRAYGQMKLAVLMRWQTLLAHQEPNLLAHGLLGWDRLLKQVQGLEKT